MPVLNTDFLNQKIRELDLKQWWIAEQLGVDRKTVGRWVRGQVKSVQEDKVLPLAHLLGCHDFDLILASDVDRFATMADQQSAAKCLLDSSLIDKLGPVGEWNVIENLIRASLVSGLSEQTLGKLYNSLTIALWRQSQIREAEKYNAKAEDIARKLKDNELLAPALMNKANIYSWRGKTSSSVKTYKECLGLKGHLTPRSLGGVYSNLSSVLYESGEYSESLALQCKAIEVFKKNGRPMNLSIAHTHMVFILLELKDFAKGIEHCEIARHQAEIDEYKRGLAVTDLLMGVLLANIGNSKKALDLAEKGLSSFRAMNIEEGLNYELAAKAHRLCKSSEQAFVYADIGISLAKEYPVYLAGLYFERAKILHSLQRSDQPAARKAIDLYLQVEAPLKAREVQKWLESK